MAETYYSALHYAAKAEKAALRAEEAAQQPGRVIQLGFDGAMQDGVLVFTHAPSGVEVPYTLLDEHEYELDLSYTGADLSSLTEMYVKNGSDTIRFVSAEHRSSTEPATVGDMKAVMRYNSDTGYRWLFKAAYKVTPSGDKVFLLYPVIAKEDTSKITNCITEIPQDIKLELNDGTLTLKAGSKVYVPNGVGVFDEVVIESDVVYEAAWTSSGSGILYYHQSTNNIRLIADDRLWSGSTAPTVTSVTNLWYDTASNQVKLTTNSGSSWTGGRSFPLARLSWTYDSTTGSNTITSIDQVFNGFGYIGSTVFALPGVKGLIPNGRNADGSLRNTEFTYTKCATITNSSSYEGKRFFYFYNSNVITDNTGHYEQDTEPSSWVRKVWFDTAENKVWFNGDGGKVQVLAAMCASAVFNNNSVITSFNPKTAFHAVDRNDSSWVAGQAMPSGKYIDLTLGASGATYTAPANGWVYVAKVAGASGKFCSLQNQTTSLGSDCWGGASASWNRCYIPVRKSDVVLVQYDATGDVKAFRFIYAEGEA